MHCFLQPCLHQYEFSGISPTTPLEILQASKDFIWWKGQLTVWNGKRLILRLFKMTIESELVLRLENPLENLQANNYFVWWIGQLTVWNGKTLVLRFFRVTIESDALLISRRATSQKIRTGEPW